MKDDAGNIKAEKWELAYPGITGFITGVSTFDGDYGMNILISMKDEDEEEFTVSLKASGMYGEDFLHKLPNVDMSKEVSMKCLPANGTYRPNCLIKQEDETIKNAFNVKKDGEWVTLIDGYPVVDDKKVPKNSEAWKIFFAMRREWVIEYLTEKGLLTEATPAQADEDSF